MLVTQCPRCHESVCVPDALLAGGDRPPSSARAQCPWCLETLDSSELRAALPPALVLVGEQAVLSSGDTATDDWPGISHDTASAHTNDDTGREGGAFQAESHFRDADILLEDHAEHTQAFDSEVSEMDSTEIAPADEEDENELAFQQSVVSEPATAGAASGTPPQRVIKIRVPGKSGVVSDKPAAMMDIDASQTRRRSKKGSPLKTVIGVALGGLLALPIVGIILHYATGQYVPYISDILPGGGSSRAQVRTNAPMPIDYSQPSAVPQTDQAPSEGQSMGEDITSRPAQDELPDPAEVALDAITSDTSNSNATPNTGESTLLTPDAPENRNPLPTNTVPDAEIPAATASNAATLQNNVPDTNGTDSGLPDSGLPDSVGVDDRLADIVVPDNMIPDSALPDGSLFDNALPGNDVPASNDVNDFDPDSMLPDSTGTGNEADATNPLDVATDNTSTLDAPATAPDPRGPTASATKTDASSDDLFGGASEIPVPAAVAPMNQSSSMNVDAEIIEVGDLVDQITALSADAPQRGELTQQLYESLSRLVGEVPAKSVEKLNPLLNKIAANTNLVIAFAKATPGWVNRTAADRGGDGAVVVGRMSGDAGNATFTLLGGQELPVTLPPSVSTVPAGFQVGLGRLTGNGANASLTLDLMQGIKQ